MLGSAIKMSILGGAVGNDYTDFYFPPGVWCLLWDPDDETGPCITSTG